MHTKGHRQVLVPVLTCPKEHQYFWSTGHFLPLVYIYYMPIFINYSGPIELFSISYIYHFLQIFILKILTWLLFIPQYPVQASFPSGCFLGSLRQGPPFISKPLCVSIIILIILHCLCICFSPPVDQEPLKKWFICSFIIAGLFKT